MGSYFYAGQVSLHLSTSGAQRKSRRTRDRRPATPVVHKVTRRFTYQLFWFIFSHTVMAMTKSEDELAFQQAVAANVRSAVAAAEFSQKETARRIEMSFNPFNSRFRGHVPFDIIQLRRIAQLFDIPITKLIQVDEDKA